MVKGVHALTAEVTFREVETGEQDVLAEWLSSDVWLNYTDSVISKENAYKWIANGRFHGEGKKTFWVCLAEGRRVGLLQLYDLLDPTAVFDLRINSNARGQGIGKCAVSFATAYIFQHVATVRRIEAITRQDNVAMRSVLQACSYVKEAHYRQAWRAFDVPSGWVDTVAYAILRSDFEHHTMTPVDWDS